MKWKDKWIKRTSN